MTLAEFERQDFTVAAASPICGIPVSSWHLHPFEDPARHDPLPNEVSFAEFIAVIERHF